MEEGLCQGLFTLAKLVSIVVIIKYTGTKKLHLSKYISNWCNLEPKFYASCQFS